MKALISIVSSLFCALLFLSCSSNFKSEDWEGAVFVSPTDYNGNDFPNDSARIELLSDSVCKVSNLSYIEFDDSIKWPDEFVGKWDLYEHDLIISYGNRQTSFSIMTFDIDADFKPYGVTLRYYIGDPDEMVYHVLTEETNQLK